MLCLTESGLLQCLHPAPGKVAVAVTQTLVCIQGSPVLVDHNTVSRPVNGCKHPGSINSKPCTSTLSAVPGYSNFVRIQGKRICLDSITGITDSVPPSSYKVTHPGQAIVRETSSG